MDPNATQLPITAVGAFVVLLVLLAPLFVLVIRIPGLVDKAIEKHLIAHDRVLDLKLEAIKAMFAHHYTKQESDQRYSLVAQHFKLSQDTLDVLGDIKRNQLRTLRAVNAPIPPDPDVPNA